MKAFEMLVHFLPIVSPITHTPIQLFLNGNSKVRIDFLLWENGEGEELIVRNKLTKISIHVANLRPINVRMSIDKYNRSKCNNG